MFLVLSIPNRLFPLLSFKLDCPILKPMQVELGAYIELPVLGAGIVLLCACTELANTRVTAASAIKNLLEVLNINPQQFGINFYQLLVLFNTHEVFKVKDHDLWLLQSGHMCCCRTMQTCSAKRSGVGPNRYKKSNGRQQPGPEMMSVNGCGLRGSKGSSLCRLKSRLNAPRHLAR